MQEPAGIRHAECLDAAATPGRGSSASSGPSRPGKPLSLAEFDAFCQDAHYDGVSFD
jgi:hypothetical protein